MKNSLKTIFAGALPVAILGGALMFGAISHGAAEGAVKIPAPIADEKPADGLETAVFAGGCFWGVQAVFEHVKGVDSAVAGYAGGHVPNPTYEQVGSETTGHAETVKIVFDPKGNLVFRYAIIEKLVDADDLKELIQTFVENTANMYNNAPFIKK